MIDEHARRVALQSETLSFLARRLARGFGKGGLRLGDGGKAIKLEVPIHLLQYIATFEPKRLGLMGNGQLVDRLGLASPSARAFVNICDIAARARRGRPPLTPEQIEKRELGSLSERQMYRMMKRNDQFRAFVANPSGLLGLLPESD